LVETPDTLVALLRQRALQQPGRAAYTFLSDGERQEASLTYGELDRQARTIGSHLQSEKAAGERVMLLYPPGLEYITAFFGCLYAGAIAVPAYPPRLNRSLQRLHAIVTDAQAAFALTTQTIYSRVQPLLAENPDLQALRWLATDHLTTEAADDWRDPLVSDRTLAFLQYTSGSTNSAKGVMVTHANLLHNEEMIRRAFRQSSESIIVGWLPLYHDMGLIGNVLQPLFLNASCVLLPSVSFLQQPARWLQAISKYRGTTSGGPNFAYDLCVGKVSDEQRTTLDLSSWSVAFNGAEPVRAKTLKRFAAAFEPCGFRPEAFQPCYGLAEATLIVSGGRRWPLPIVKTVQSKALETGRLVETIEKEVAEPIRSLVSCGEVAEEQRIVIADPQSLTSCAPDEIGEVWVSGPGVAAGYWNRVEETDRTFQAYLAETDQGPFLRTGDLGFVKDGELFITGRLKDLIVIRGRNHYPQDIELTVEQSHPALRPGCGAAFSIEVSDEERLAVVQEVDPRQGPSSDGIFESIREAIFEEHEVAPYAILLLQPRSIPKTSSGKIQRQVCRTAFQETSLEVIAEWRETGSSESEGLISDSTGAPRSLEQIEAWLASYLAERLGIDCSRIDVNRPITRYGLDSLFALEWMHSIESRLCVDISMSSLLQSLSISELAGQIAAQLSGDPAVSQRAPLLPDSESSAEVPLSHGQEALWFLHQLAPESAAYNLAFAARIHSITDTLSLRRAFHELIERHSSLRTTFPAINGRPVQRVHERVDLSLHEEDATAWSEQLLDERLSEEAHRPFDLEYGPLLRINLFRRAKDEQILLLTVHHIAVDFWSLALLVHELGLLYEAKQSGTRTALSQPSLQYADYSRWQDCVLASAEGERLRSFWQERLSGELPLLNLPTDRPRPALQTYRGASLPFRLGEKLTENLKTLSRASGTTLYMTLLAAFQTLLYRYTEQQDILVGSPTTGRRFAELTGLIGYFVNPVVLRAHPSGDLTFAEFLDQVRQNVLSAFEHQDYPFALLVEKLQPERDASRSPLFQAMFILHRSHLPHLQALAGFALGESGTRMKLGKLSLESVALKQRVAQFDLTLMMAEVDGALMASLQYNTDLFDAATIGRMHEHLLTLLEGVVAQPEQRLSSLPLLTPSERHQLIVAWNDTKDDYPQHKTIHKLFEEQVARTPDATALVHDHERISFHELNSQSNQLARYLRALGVGPEVPVGICVERSIEMVVALLGVLKAGGAYVPLDPAYPKVRVALMVEDSQAPVLLTQSDLLERLPEQAAHVLCLDTEWGRVARHSRDNLSESAISQNLAYLIYTSGSTGKPKGVAIEHRSAAALINWAQKIFTEDELGAVLASTSICFDLSVFELFVTLCRGGQVVLAEDALQLASLPAAGEVTLLNTVPSAMTELLKSSQVPPSVRTVNLAGEPLLNHLVQHIYQSETIERVFNLYGPSEDTTYSTFALMKKGGSENSLIGRPISNTQVYLLDAQMQPVPIGVPGELYLGGDGLARGYLHRPDLTALKFIPNPFSVEGGARLYNTEDLARYLPDGNMEFLGRIDNQVKLRGFRIELGEIETALGQHAQVREAVVVARDDELGDKRLVAYVVAERGYELAGGELRSFLHERLPHFMIPPVFVMLDALPLTPNGKVDRRALPVPDASVLEVEAPFVSARTPVEEVLAGIWSEVLGVARAGVHDNFFELGGHSLLGTQIISRVRQVFKIELPLRSLFEGPTIADLSKSIEQAMKDHSALAAPPIRRIVANEKPPLSFAQQRLWFLDQLEPDSPAYNLPAAIRLQGNLDSAALERSFNETVSRHESLRTTFLVVEGEPVQFIAPHSELKLAYVDLSATEEREREARLRATAEAQGPFDLSRGPLIRATLLRLSELEHVLLFTMHHIVSDGWSLGILRREVAALYEAYAQGRPAALPELSIQYADFAVWQREWLQGAVLEEQLSYWRGQLGGGSPVLELPLDRARPAVQSLRGARQSLLLSETLTRALEALSRREGVTLFMTLLAGFQTLLYRYSGQEDIAVGTPIANRNRAETEELIGFFVNTLVLRCDLSGNPSVRELLQRVREVALGGYAHQDVPFEKLVEELQPERNLSHSPLFQVMFGLQNAAAGALELEGLSLSPLEIESGVTKFDLVLNLQETEQGLQGSLEYSTDLFDVGSVEQLLSHYQKLLAGMVADPEARLLDLPLLTAAEREQLLVEWNETGTAFPGEATLPELFEEQAAARPAAAALSYEAEQLSYGELNERANQVAHYLRRQGVGAEVVVGILMARSLALVSAVLGVLKAGGAYLPLDPSYPPERLAYMMAETGAAVVLTQAELVSRVPPGAAPVICLERDWRLLADESRANPGAAVSAENLAYIMYTSGSTGEPKGVSVSHQAVVRLVKETGYAQFGAEEVFLQYAPLSFDASTFELWGSLLNGGQLVLMPAGVASLAELGAVVRRRQVTTLWLTAGLFQQMVEERLSDLQGVRQLLAGGDVLPVAQVEKLLRELPAGGRLINGYGPTENTTFSCCHQLTAKSQWQGSVPIGRPIANTEVYVVDSHWQPVPRGVAGELLIGGAGLARGYWQRPELTAERFIPHPFSQEPGARLYRSGDRVRYLAGGEIEFLGRLDHQVKLRGFRIEPGEIESRLNAHPALRAAVVVLHEDESRAQELVAYVVAESQQAPPLPGELRRYLQQSLPPYMIPALFVPLAELPLTANGKVDRQALPAPSGERPELTGEYVAPRNATEEQLARLWAAVLGCERVGVADNFFELGGHSLLATQLVSKLRQTFKVELPLRTLFERPTIAQLAEVIAEQQARPQDIEVETIQAMPRGSRDLNQLLAQVENLSTDDVKRLIKEKKLLRKRGLHNG